MPSAIKTHLPRLISVALIALLLPVMFLLIRSPFNFYDEGFALTGGQRVLDGQAPYRDFWGIYPPGQFYALAGVFKLFGANVLTARVYDTLVRFAAALAAFALVGKTANRRLAWLALMTVGLLLAAAGFYAYAVFPALALGLWALWAWLKGLESGKPAWRAVAGVLFGLAALVRWDLAVYGAAGAAAAGYLYALHGGGRRRWLTALFAPAGMLAAMLLTAGLGYAAVGLRSGWGNLFEQVFYFPAVKLHEVRALAYPALLDVSLKLDGAWMQFYLPLAGMALVLGALGCALTRRAKTLAVGGYTTLALAIFSLGLFNQALSRYDFIHVTPASIAIFLAVCGLTAHAARLARGRALLILSGALLAIYALMYLPLALRVIAQNVARTPPWGCFSKIEKAGCVYIDPDQEAALRYIKGVVRPGQPLFVGNTRHDKVFVGDSGFYFLADRPIATRYDEIHPGVVNTLPVQEEIIGELERNPPPWIVLVDIWESTEPNASALSTGVTVLDEYLQARYRPVLQSGWYHILKRRGE